MRNTSIKDTMRDHHVHLLVDCWYQMLVRLYIHMVFNFLLECTNVCNDECGSAHGLYLCVHETRVVVR